VSDENDTSKSRMHGLWALTNRELKKWYKAPVIFLLSIIQPLIWMGLLGIIKAIFWPAFFVFYMFKSFGL